MRTFLDRMRDLKNQEILQRSADEPLEALREKALDGQCPSNFAEAVKDKGNGFLEIIAEVKARAPGDGTWVLNSVGRRNINTEYHFNIFSFWNACIH